MAGMPQRRARRQVPTLPVLRVPPDVWHRMTDTERIVALLGGNLDNIHQCVSIPYADADIHTRNNHVRIFEISVKAGLKLHADRERDTGREQALSELARALIDRDAARLPVNPLAGDTLSDGAVAAQRARPPVDRDTRMHTPSAQAETGHNRDTEELSR